MGVFFLPSASQILGGLLLVERSTQSGLEPRTLCGIEPRIFGIEAKYLGFLPNFSWNPEFCVLDQGLGFDPRILGSSLVKVPGSTPDFFLEVEGSTPKFFLDPIKESLGQFMDAQELFFEGPWGALGDALDGAFGGRMLLVAGAARSLPHGNPNVGLWSFDEVPSFFSRFMPNPFADHPSKGLQLVSRGFGGCTPKNLGLPEMTGESSPYQPRAVLSTDRKVTVMCQGTRFALNLGWLTLSGSAAGTIAGVQSPIVCTRGAQPSPSASACEYGNGTNGGVQSAVRENRAGKWALSWPSPDNSAPSPKHLGPSRMPGAPQGGTSASVSPMRMAMSTQTCPRRYPSRGCDPVSPPWTLSMKYRPPWYLNSLEVLGARVPTVTPHDSSSQMGERNDSRGWAEYTAVEFCHATHGSIASVPAVESVSSSSSQRGDTIEKGGDLSPTPWRDLSVGRYLWLVIFGACGVALWVWFALMYGSLPVGGTRLATVFYLCDIVGAVCPTCRGFVSGCAFDTDGKCPWISTTAANVAAGLVTATAGAFTLKGLLPPNWLSAFPRAAQDTLLVLARMPAAGTPFDVTEATSVAELKIAWRQGRLSRPDVGNAIDSLITRCEAEELPRLQVQIKNLELELRDDAPGSTEGGGVYHYILSRVTHFVLRLDASSALRGASDVAHLAVSRGQDLASQVLFPLESLADVVIPQVVHYFCAFVHAFGFEHIYTVVVFVNQVVYDTVLKLGYTWAFGFELLLVYLKELDLRQKAGLTMANVWESGAQDTFLTRARNEAVKRYGSSFVFFRTHGGNPGRRAPAGQPGPSREQADKSGKVKWNGKDTPGAAKACFTFQFRGREHPPGSLLPDGTCKFKHICDHWVSNKGPGGVCGACHGRHECDSAHKCAAKQQ